MCVDGLEMIDRDRKAAHSGVYFTEKARTNLTQCSQQYRTLPKKEKWVIVGRFFWWQF